MNRMMIPLMLLLGGAPALAQPVSGARAEAREQLAQERLDRMTSKLGLDQAQAGRVRATFEKYRAELQPLRKQQWETRLQLKAELESAQPNDGKIAQLTNELQGGRQAMQAIHARRMAELKQELSPKQYAELVLGRGMHGRRFHGRGRFAPAE